jgi:hypothetical protein
MKAETPDDAGLSRVLHEWKVDASLPPRFPERVWTTIATRESARAHRWAWMREALWGTLTRPAFAISYAVLLLAAGWFAGTWQAHEASQRAGETMGIRYVQSLDPYQMSRH